MFKICKSPIFIVGNSRSGTTLMSNILRRHSEIHGLSEIHFFEQLWSPESEQENLDTKAAISFGQRLLAIATEGRLSTGSIDKYQLESAEMVNRLNGCILSYPAVYKAFIYHECRKNGKQIPCEQTPRYIYFLDDVFEIFPDARILVMVRDPRDILLSQKTKWKKQQYRATPISALERLRTWANYHPMLLSQMWKKAMVAADRYRDDSRVKWVYFEELLKNPTDSVADVCSFLNVTFYPDMLTVPKSRSVQAESYAGSDSDGISVLPIARWKEGLNTADVFWCQAVAGRQMKGLGYNVVELSPNLVKIGLSAMTMPIKAAIALAMNLSQSKDLLGSIHRRLFS